MSFSASVQAKAVELAKLVVEMTTAAGSGHPTSANSLAQLVTVLMYSHMRFDPEEPRNPAADRLVLSEGHAVPIVYAAAADLGIVIGKPGQERRMTREDAMQLRAIGSEIDGHPNPMEGFPFFDAATGSLGQGLSISAGLAAAARLDHNPKRIFCIIGDGESREGQIAEALDFIVDQKLLAVLPIFNCNAFGQSDRVSPQQSPQAWVKKLEAYGFDVKLIDGHNPEEARATLDAHAELAERREGRPLAVVMQTVKGWGSPTIEGPGHHGTPVPPEELPKVLAELDETARRVGAHWTEGDLHRPALPELPEPQPPTSTPVPGTLGDALRRAGKAEVLGKGKWAPRKAFGLALKLLGHADHRIVVLDGDVRNSTYTEDFADDPALAPRFFECRIAEQNLFSTAAGLSAGGKLPFASTFGKFVTRGYDQIEIAINSGANLKIVGTHVGVSLASDGPSQMALPDVAWFRAWTRVKLPDGRGGRAAMYVLNPADAWSAYQLTVEVARHDGPCYLRAMRPDVPLLYSETVRFRLGGYQLLSPGRDVVILATGYAVHEARKAQTVLKNEGVDAALIDVYSLPFDHEAVLDIAQRAGGSVLTVEDNYAGGLGSEVAERIAEDGGSFVLRQMFVRRVPKSGRTPDDLVKYCGIAAEDIVREVKGLVGIGAG